MIALVSVAAHGGYQVAFRFMEARADMGFAHGTAVNPI